MPSTLPPAVHNAFIHAYANSLHSVFLAAAPVAAVGFLISWKLPEVKLRRAIAAADPDQALGMPTDHMSVQAADIDAEPRAA